MSRSARNRLALCLVIVAVVAGIYAVTAYDLQSLLRLADSPAYRLEQSGFADVLHFGYVESQWANNMIVHVAAILYPPMPDFSDAYVVIEDDNYVIKRGGYEWEPGKLEPPDVKFSHWTVAKFKHYSEDALFPPSKFEPAQQAIQELVGWMNEERSEAQDAAMRDWLYAVVLEASKYEDWNWIEIDLFQVSKEPEPGLIATEKYRPKWSAHYRKAFTHTIFIYRRSPETVQEWAAGEDKWVEAAWFLDNLLDEGELTPERLEWMLTTGQLQMQPTQTVFGQVSYGYEFNDPWQGREIDR